MRSGRWTAYAAAVWMAIFAIVHAYWAFGGGLGLPRGLRVPDRPALLAVDAAAVPLCAAGAVLALSLVRPWRRRLPRRWRIGLMWGGAALAFVHSAPAIADDLLGALRLLDLRTLSADEQFAHFLYEPFWMLGAVLCALAALAATSSPLRREQSRDGGEGGEHEHARPEPVGGRSR